MFGLIKSWRRWRLAARPFPEVWNEILQTRWPLFHKLPPPLRDRLKRRIQILLAEVQFEGVRGFRITDEVRVLIAAQACLLLLGNDRADFHELKSVLIHPDNYDFESTEILEGGVVHESLEAVDGESWDFGTVTLSWPAVDRGTRNRDYGQNVVIHEFAHQLDQADGLADGAPAMRHLGRYAAWQQVFRREFERLQDQVRRGRRTVMDDYGATDPAEFFAVATECFFEKPRQLKKHRPELYEELRIFYGQDPASYTSITSALDPGR